MPEGYEAVLNGPLAGTSGAFTTFTGPQDISAAAFPYATIPNQLSVGRWLHLTAFGQFSSTGTPSLTLGFYYGGASGGVVLAASAATAVPNNSTNLPWRMELDVIVQAIGAGSNGSVRCSGYLDLGLTVATVTHTPLPVVAPAVVTLDTTLSKLISVGATWSASSASNSITTHGFGVEQRY